MEDNIYKNKYAVKAAIGAIKTLKKINPIKDVSILDRCLLGVI